MATQPNPPGGYPPLPGVLQPLQNFGLDLINSPSSIPASILGTHTNPPRPAGTPSYDQPFAGMTSLNPPGQDLVNAIKHAIAPTPTSPAAKAYGPDNPVTSQELMPNLSYQAMVSDLMKPYISGVGAPNPSVNRTAAADLQAGRNTVTSGATTLPQSIQGQIASTLHNSAMDYRSGLTAMLHTLPSQQPLEAEIAGIKSLISYPYGLTAATAPPSIQGSPVLMQLYAVLQAMRSGGALPSNAASGGAAGAVSGYGGALNQTILQGG